MATAFIHLRHNYFSNMCKAYLEASGHTVTDHLSADIAIIDMDYGIPPTVPNTKLLILISATNYSRRELPAKAIFWLKPVDVHTLMDFVLDEIKFL